MQLAQYTYAGLLLATISIPLALSFDKKVRFYTNWKYILPAIMISAFVFLMWDVRFTEAEIWSFNLDYVTGYGYMGLPVEEWLFFICIPYASLFLYEVLKSYMPKFEIPNVSYAISLVVIAGSAVLCYYNLTRLYTFFNFLFLAIYFGYTIFRNKFKQHLTKFYLTFLVSLLPFLIVNGILTGIPVVEYNPEYILGLRIITIPVEDFGYFFLLLLMNTTIYEALKEGKYY